MDNIKTAIDSLQDSISTEKRREKGVEDALMQLSSTVILLKLSTVPPNTLKRLSELLRQRLLPLYQVSLTRALQYSTAVLEFIQHDKLIPALNAKDEPLKQSWEQLLTSLVSGMLDYLDQSPDTQSRESTASVLYPILSRIYFSPLAISLSEYNGSLLSLVYQLLVTTVEPQTRNAARLRDHGISSKRLSLTLSQIRDFLAIESLLDIICILIPPIKNGLEKRSQFIKDVFDPDLFQCSKSILEILESITDGDWSITAVKIIEALANSDISFPQPFDASSLMICGISVNAIAPFYVDKTGFLANLDQDGKVETLYVPFHTITRVVGSSINSAEISIVLVLTMPPVIGTEPLSVPSGRRLSVSWHLKKSQLDKFANAAKDRNLIFLNSTTRKLSIPGTHIAFNLPADKQPQALISTQERIHDMAKLLAIPSSPEQPESDSPINQPSDCSSPRDQKAEDITQSAELATTIVEDDAEHQTFSVFLDHRENLSLTDPSCMMNEVSIEQSLGDDTVLTVSSPSGLLRRPAERATKNQDDVAGVTSRATRSDDIVPQIVQKLPTAESKKKSVPTKNPLAIKWHTNLQMPQATTLDTQLHSVILGQGHSPAPIDIGKFPDSKESIPLLETQKRRSAAPGIMVREVTKPVTEPLDEARQLEDSSLETNLSPVDFEPKRKRRSFRNMEDGETIYEQERPTKRARIENSLHITLPYQRKKYGRNGRTLSPRAESPAVPTVGFDEISEPKPTRAVERPKPRISAMKGKRIGKKMEGKPAATQRRKQEHRDAKMDVKPTASKVPVSLAKPIRDKYARESLLEIDHDPSTFVSDIVMIDLTQDSPIPARIPTKVFSKSSLKEDKPVANVQPALPGKPTQKVKVENLSPHPPPAKDRRKDRPSVSFALPPQPQQYPWTETSTPARKQRTDLDLKSHRIRRSWEKSAHNKATSRGLHQQRYTKAEEKKYEQPEEPIEKIAEIIKQIGETVVHKISRRFDSVRDELHAGHRSILQGTLEHLERMHEESVAHVTNMVQLEQEYAFRCGNILKGFDDIRESAKNVSSCLENIVKDHNQQSLSKRFPPKLFGELECDALNGN